MANQPELLQTGQQKHPSSWSQPALNTCPFVLTAATYRPGRRQDDPFWMHIYEEYKAGLVGWGHHANVVGCWRSLSAKVANKEKPDVLTAV